MQRRSLCSPCRRAKSSLLDMTLQSATRWQRDRRAGVAAAQSRVGNKQKLRQRCALADKFGGVACGCTKGSSNSYRRSRLADATSKL